MNIFGLNITLLLWILGVIFGFILLILWGTYNSFISQRNKVKTDFADIDVQLRRRTSLIENLVEVVREYAKHERGTFDDVTKARAALEKPHGPKESAQADNFLTSAMKSLFAVVEAYPDLQASNNYKDLRQDIKDTENSIAQYREQYNQTILSYNTMVQSFPNLLIAKLFGFEEEELFQIGPEDKQEIEIKADSNA